MGARVTRVATDGDRKFTTLLGPGWEALQRPGDWAFDMPVMARDRLIDAAGSLSGCFVLSDFHHLLKVLRYRVLGSGTFASLSSPDCRLTFTSEVWGAIHFSDASLRNEAATTMDDGLAARFFSWKHFLKLLAAIDLANNALASGGDEASHIWQTVLAAYWFFVLGACIHLVISEELAPEERVGWLRSASRRFSPLSCRDRRFPPRAGLRDSARG
jgi:hypothetical protein